MSPVNYKLYACVTKFGTYNAFVFESLLHSLENSDTFLGVVAGVDDKALSEVTLANPLSMLLVTVELYHTKHRRV